MFSFIIRIYNLLTFDIFLTKRATQGLGRGFVRILGIVLKLHFLNAEFYLIKKPIQQIKTLLQIQKITQSFEVSFMNLI